MTTLIILNMALLSVYLNLNWQSTFCLLLWMHDSSNLLGWDRNTKSKTHYFFHPLGRFGSELAVGRCRFGRWNANLQLLVLYCFLWRFILLEDFEMQCYNLATPVFQCIINVTTGLIIIVPQICLYVSFYYSFFQNDKVPVNPNLTIWPSRWGFEPWIPAVVL